MRTIGSGLPLIRSASQTGSTTTVTMGGDAKAVLAQFRRLVRYLKRWRDIQFSETVAAKVYSIGLTVMVKEQLQCSFSTEGARQDHCRRCARPWRRFSHRATSPKSSSVGTVSVYVFPRSRAVTSFTVRAWIPEHSSTTSSTASRIN